MKVCEMGFPQRKSRAWEVVVDRINCCQRCGTETFKPVKPCGGKLVKPIAKLDKE